MKCSKESSAKRSCRRTVWPMLFVAAGISVGPSQAWAERCDWSVKGTLKVEHARLGKVKNVFGDTSPLENVQVKVSARTRVLGVWGTWNPWPKTRTDANGDFEVTNRKNCADRQIKVQVKFDDDELEIRHERATISTTKVPWYEVVHDGDAGRVRTSSTVRLGTLTFQPGGAHMLGEFEARSQGELWHLYSEIIDHMAAKGPEFAFKKKVKVKYPHDNWVAGDILPNTVEASYANPHTRVIYIHKDSNGTEDQFDVETLIHELGHIYAYERFHGEICLTMDLIKTGYTHDLADAPCVPFHESFAKFWQQQLEHELLNQPVELPYNRAQLNSGVGYPVTALTNLDRMQRLDEGWWSVLTTLTTPDLHRYDFGVAGGARGDGHVTKQPAGVPMSCESPNITFKNVLKVLHPNASAGYPEYLRRDETTIEGFMTRASAILAKMDDKHREMYVALADPAGDAQPADTLCEEPQVGVDPNLPTSVLQTRVQR